MVYGARAPSSVLIVDDEPAIVEILSTYLRDEGFNVHVAHDGDEALRVVERERPDLVLLDLSLPTMSGVEVFRAIRTDSDLPVIMVTSRVNEIDRVVGLELGADDYIGKPFSPREVVARVKTVLRRTNGRRSGPAGVQRFGDIEFDRVGHEVRRAGRAINVTPTEFRILRTLIDHAGRTFTRAQLLDAVTDDQLDIYDRTLDRHIANVRQKLEPDPTHPRHIVTVFGVGYKFVEG
jgi:two-component system alkaline phosphatase synthesis response regulator PhoP